MELDNAKGTRDIMPEQKILRDSIIDKIKSSFEIYGFLPIETPTIELYSTLSFKYAGGQEILKETFKLTDQGKRKLGLRYDLTVPFARVIAMNSNLKMPFKRYQIANVYRDGPIKLGRYREFIQCDADIAGTNSMIADAEMLALAEDVFNKINIPYIVKVNNRKLLNGILEYIGVKEKDYNSVITSLDKLAKIGKEEVKKELSKKLNSAKIDDLFKIMNIEGTSEDILIELKQKLKNKNSDEGIEELEELFSNCNLMELKNIQLDITLARGLNYYNSTVYEVYLVNNKIKSSVAAGGRYDNMIGNFLSSDVKVPAVGISFGLDVIVDALYDPVKSKKTNTKVYVIPIKTLNEPLRLLQVLRRNNINSDIDFNKRGISKNLDYANKYGIPYCIIIGEKELAQELYTLRDMITGKEELLNEKQIIEKLKEN